MLDFARDLCRDVTGSRCAMPRLSDWGLVQPASASIGVDVADVATGGAGAVIPANVKVYGSKFSSGLEYDGPPGGFSSAVEGYGGGAGAGLGWGLPFVGAKGVGSISGGLKKKILESVGKVAQGQLEKLLAGAIFGGISGGTRLVSGPDVSGRLTTDDFHNSFACVTSLGANFVVNGVSCGVVIISKARPVLSVSDLVYTRAIGLMGGVGLATSLDIEATGMVYRLQLV